MERIWVYQASRELGVEEEQYVASKLEAFTAQWKVHGKPLAASVAIRYHRFVIIAVDQSVAMPSGCSIDKSVHLLKELEQELQVEFFDRMQMAYRDEQGIVAVSRQVFERLIEEGKIDTDTIVFNNLVSSREELETKWEVPFKESWHAKVFQMPNRIR